jgi:hypothetical protein
MAVTLKGCAVVWGTGGITATGVIINETTSKNQSANLSLESEKQEITNNDGETVGKIYYNYKQTFEISIIPVDADASPTISGAKTNLQNLLPDPGTLITIVDNDLGTGGRLYNGGKFLVERARLSRTNKGMATIDLTCETYRDKDIAANVGN